MLMLVTVEGNGNKCSSVNMISTIELQMRCMGKKLAHELIELPEKTTLLVEVISHINWTRPQRLRRSYQVGLIPMSPAAANQLHGRKQYTRNGRQPDVWLLYYNSGYSLRLNPALTTMPIRVGYSKPLG